MLRPETTAYLTKKLPEIHALAASGMNRWRIATALHCAAVTLCQFLEDQGITLPGQAPQHRRVVRINAQLFDTKPLPGQPPTPDQLHLRRMHEMTPEELDMIEARLRERLATSQAHMPTQRWRNWASY